MKKQYIYFATNNGTMAEMMKKKLDDLFFYYNCHISSKAYKKIYDLWDELDELSMEKQSNSLIIFDPRIYINIPEVIENGDDNFWHKLRSRELYPWYELVLRYPLLTPMFLTSNNKLFSSIKKIDPFCYVDTNKDINKQLNVNVTRFLDGFRTWFDPFGLRAKWREKVLRAMFRDELSENQQTNIYREINRTVYCIEDEIEYALFSGYTAYKHGANVNIVNSYATLKFARESIRLDNKNVSIIRDLDLRFRDHIQGVENRDSLKKMKNLFPKNINLDNLVISSNIEEIEGIYKIQKPLDSLYEVVKKCKNLNIEDKRFFTIKDKKQSKEKKNNHSAPYLNMQLSKDILSISTKSSNSYTDKVFKALLHMEAYMLLNNMAPTTSMQILKDLHLAELDFELSFIGIDKNQKIKDRKNDVENDIDRLLKNIDSPNLKNSFLISFWNDAKAVYKKHEQFNASEEANNEAMKLVEW